MPISVILISDRKAVTNIVELMDAHVINYLSIAYKKTTSNQAVCNP